MVSLILVMYLWKKSFCLSLCAHAFFVRDVKVGRVVFSGSGIFACSTFSLFFLWIWSSLPHCSLYCVSLSDIAQVREC